MAQRKHFPSVSWLTSYTKYEDALRPFFVTFDPEFPQLRTEVRQLLQEEQELQEIVQLVGRDSLAEPDKLTLDVARMIREDFLQQNSYTPYDRVSPMWKTFGMLRNFMHYNTLCRRELKDSQADKRITYESLAHYMSPQVQKLVQMKFIDPADGEDKGIKSMHALYDEIEVRIRSFTD